MPEAEFKDAEPSHPMDELLQRKPYDPVSNARANFYAGPDLRRQAVKLEFERRMALRVKAHEEKQHELISKTWSDFSRGSARGVYQRDRVALAHLRADFEADMAREFRHQFPLGHAPTYPGAYKRMAELDQLWSLRPHPSAEARLMWHLSKMEAWAMLRSFWAHYPTLLLHFGGQYIRGRIAVGRARSCRPASAGLAPWRSV